MIVAMVNVYYNTNCLEKRTQQNTAGVGRFTFD